MCRRREASSPYRGGSYWLFVRGYWEGVKQLLQRSAGILPAWACGDVSAPRGRVSLPGGKSCWLFVRGYWEGVKQLLQRSAGILPAWACGDVSALQGLIALPGGKSYWLFVRGYWEGVKQLLQRSAGILPAWRLRRCVGAARPHRPTGGEEVGMMPTLLEGEASSLPPITTNS
jgi:hypothetical protein